MGEHDHSLELLSELGVLYNLDERKEVSFDELPNMFRQMVQKLIETGIVSPITPDSNLLALAAGTGKAERKFADLITIDPSKIVYVDKDPMVSFKEGRVEKKSIAVYLREALNNLEAKKGERFSFITAMGIDYIFNDPDQVLALFKVIKHMIKPGGVFIFDGPTFTPVDKIAQLGFTNQYRNVYTLD